MSNEQGNYTDTRREYGSRIADLGVYRETELSELDRLAALWVLSLLTVGFVSVLMESAWREREGRQNTSQRDP